MPSNDAIRLAVAYDMQDQITNLYGRYVKGAKRKSTFADVMDTYLFLKNLESRASGH